MNWTPIPAPMLTASTASYRNGWACAGPTERRRRCSSPSRVWKLIRPFLEVKPARPPRPARRRPGLRLVGDDALLADDLDTPLGDDRVDERGALHGDLVADLVPGRALEPLDGDLGHRLLLYWHWQLSEMNSVAVMDER